MSKTLRYLRDSRIESPTLTSTRRYSRYAGAVLAFFACHRTATAEQVRRSLSHIFRTDRCTRMHLQTLVAAKELVLLRDSCLAPNVYVVTAKGLRQAGVESARSATPSRSHLPHELAITEFAVWANEQADFRRDLELTWQRRFELTQHDAFGWLVPDWAFAFRHTTGSMVCFVEVTSGDESARRLGDKLAAYETWSANPESHAFLQSIHSSLGAKNPRPVFRLLLIMHSRSGVSDAGRLADAASVALSRLSPDLVQRLWLTTVSDLLLTDGKDLPNWLRLRDVASALPNWSRLSPARKRTSLKLTLAYVERRSLFPTCPGASHVDTQSD